MFVVSNNTVNTPEKFIRKFYYYLFIFIELYFSNFRPLTCFSVKIPEADDEHMCSKHVEARNKTYCETKILCIKLVNYRDKYLNCNERREY